MSEQVRTALNEIVRKMSTDQSSIGGDLYSGDIHSVSSRHVERMRTNYENA